MTKTEQLAEKYADANYKEYAMDEFWGTVTDHISIKKAYKNGAQDMLERFCELLEGKLRMYVGYSETADLVDSFRKAMEE